ncbi:MAG: helix-turn-helix domain-containing protein [Ardenticatenia bacterium]|nr:helix-turn-helix domain-containing protein [Ardenticatenia bacterium]
MMDSTNATVERIDGRDAGPGVPPAMLRVDQVARMLCCSPRTIYRLTDAGKMPKPVRLGALVRWPRETIETWITLGCPQARNMEVTQ